MDVTNAPSHFPVRDPEFELLLRDAQCGSNEALGDLLTMCRPYLLSVADCALPRRLQSKVEPSDIVQQTSLEICRGLSHFRGNSYRTLLAWARKILLDNVKDVLRQFHRCQKRQVSLEHSLSATSAQMLASEENAMGACTELAGQEDMQQLLAAVAALPRSYRTVVVLRYRKDLSFSSIAIRMGRSEGAVRKLWLRALRQLAQTLKPVLN